MASKKDLVEGQSFSRRRLITAFVSGAPGGREVEPGKPMRAVVGGVILSAVLVVGALAAGLLAPTLPDGWDKGSLVIAEDTGARYVARDGVLSPVINTASARLLIPSNFQVVSADSDKLNGNERGPTLGIVGAPDALPAPSSLVTTWSACTSQADGILTTLSDSAASVPVDDHAIIATVEEGDSQGTYLVDNGTRYAIAEGLANSVRRNLGLVTSPDYRVSARWINLFAPGPDIGPFTPAGAGKEVGGTSAGLPAGTTIGTILTVNGNTAQPYIVLGGPTIAALTPFAEAMYRLDPRVAQQVVDVPSLSTGIANADPVWPTGWPTAVPVAVQGTPCAHMTTGRSGTRVGITLAQSPDAAPTDGRVSSAVPAGAGALVRAIGAASATAGPVFLIDQTGVAFPVVGTSDEDPIARLGYSSTDVMPVPQAYIALLSTGPVLSASAAQTVISTVSGR